MLAENHPHAADPELDRHCDEVLKKQLWVVCCISNPARYKSRYALYRKFRKHVLEELRLPLLTVEACLKDLDFKLSESRCENSDVEVKGHAENGVRYIDVRVKGNSWVWLKENLLNIGSQNLPHDCKYILFADADIRFNNFNIGNEIVTALQTHKVVQPWESCIDLGPHGEVIQVHRSFFACVDEGIPWLFEKEVKDGCIKYIIPRKGGIANLFHPGFCMAWRRGALDKVGGLIETGIAGAGDHHACGALVGQATKTFPGGVHENYKKAILDWQARAEDVVRGDYGFVRGLIMHNWHGPKSKRKYIERWAILVENQFDPFTDIFKNTNGVWELKHGKPKLRDDLRRYLKQRDEDSTSMDS